MYNLLFYRVYGKAWVGDQHQGGFLCSNGDVELGVKTVWRDYNKLQNYIEAVDYIGV